MGRSLLKLVPLAELKRCDLSCEAHGMSMAMEVFDWLCTATAVAVVVVVEGSLDFDQSFCV